jgi:hypothetical protein
MQQRSLVFAVFGALAVNVSVACSGSTTADDNAVPANEYWARYAAAVCDGVKPCCANEGFAYDAAACNAIVTGTLPSGSECSVTWECKPPAGREAYCAAGVCELLGEQGDPCDSPDSCASDLYCGSTGSCVLRLADGEVCGESRECQSTKCRDGTCQTPTVASAFLCAGG